jgi:hypothetical protein
VIGPGVYYGDLIFGSQNPGDSVITDTSLLPYNPGESPPFSLILTEFHVLLLYKDKIQAVSVLNKEIMWEESLAKSPRIGKIIGLCYDPVAKTLWLFAENCVFEIIASKEDRYVWEMYLNKGQYENALPYCKV